MPVYLIIDITVIDPQRQMKFSENVMRSKGKNSVFLGWDLQGLTVKTFIGGRQVFDIAELLGEIR